MVEGLKIGRRKDVQDKISKPSTTVELLAVQGTTEVTRQKIAAGKVFYLDAAGEWVGSEFIYLLAGRLLLKSEEKEILLCPGDYLYHQGLGERAHFRVEEDVELLLVSSPPSFHLARAEIQEMMALVRAVEEKDPATEGHCHRIERLAISTGEQLGLLGDRLATLSHAAYLHDIGKVKIPNSILNKPGPLTDEEWEEMRKHAVYGSEMLADKEFLAEAAKVVRSHHEHYDGTGYPDGLRGAEIPLEARIVAVVDAYDAMRSDRPYRSALSPDAALAELRKNTGTQFDPLVVEAFLFVLQRRRGA